MKKVIEINNLGKQYNLKQVGTGTLANDLKRWWYTVRGKEDPFLRIGDVNDRTKKADSDFVWALRDINFSVFQGDVLGIIGKNGAGKSTLLKILSRTTSPTVGEYKIRGRVASLLEVGTGFHPDLTGRENVFLNGAILGMTKSEIKSNFDEIVNFSGVERYIDTPVKRYSSGMYVRLAFAVAAHLNPEILIVDEVLAVGDQEFQDKCIGKMKDVSAGGKTVLFVSHNITAVRNLCNKGLYLKNGQVLMEGGINKVTDAYTFEGLNNLAERKFTDSEMRIDRYVKVNSISLLNNDAKLTNEFEVTDKINVKVMYTVYETKYSFTLHCYVKNSRGELLFVSMDNKYSPFINNPQQPGSYTEILEIDANFFNEGTYSIELLMCSFPTVVDDKFCTYDNAITFVVNDNINELGAKGSWNREWPNALVRPDFKWRFS